MGMQLSDFAQPLRQVAPFMYALDVAPRPHPAFEFYVVQITPRAGLSWIKAVGHDINTSSYGIELQSAFEKMEEKLQAMYGIGKRSEFLMLDSIWNEPKDWMMALMHKERFLSTTWDSSSGSLLRDSLQSVFLVANASDSYTGVIAIEYTLKNAADSDAEINEAQDDVL